MTLYRFTVSYEGEIEAPDPLTPRAPGRKRTWRQDAAASSQSKWNP